LIITRDFKLYAPEFLLDEFEKYEDIVLKKTHRTRKDFNHFMEILKRKIKIIPKQKIINYVEKAKKISPDPKDTMYFALALAINAKIWSNDKKLKKNQTQIDVISTDELIKINLPK